MAYVGEFVYTSPSYILSASPSSGPELGGVAISVETTALSYSKSYYCIFGTVTVRARIAGGSVDMPLQSNAAWYDRF